MILTDLPTGFHNDPWPHYAALRDAGFAWQPDGSLLLGRHADLLAIYKDTHTFRSDKTEVFGPKYGVGTPLYVHHTTSLVFNDPPLHTRVRRVLAGALTPRALARLRPGLEALVDHLIDSLSPQPDMIRDFAMAIPINVIGDLLAVPRSERAPLRDWSLAILGALEPSLTPQHMARGTAAVSDFLAYLQDLVSRRRAAPGDPEEDVLTRLIQSGDLSEAELLHNCIFILNAGHETTTNLIGNALWLLAKHPGARTGPVDRIVEEVLRLESPNQFGNRQTTRDLFLHGERVPAGTDLHLCIGAANRDPEVFRAPDDMRLDRGSARHLAFGAGPHTCVGLTLARLEATIALQRFLARVTSYELHSVVRSCRIRFRGFESLKITLPPT
ncbi:cytochrome P450 [Jannaschia pagri]|uniref:Cytochrome P450 n=1 Tax=Jannaschia pagri TaxID=2829797 RepID=A0ABQ4NQL5_9RHOB|nr:MULTISPECIES: cytochrome P450 [unclassified Jannaschia]GIT92863.1 cytochrome P450 [Jannaschia sp. AI_61]GIT96698.1 cytochrome P450 [Jannaschia sp. AI_62]